MKRENIRCVERFDFFGNPPSCSLGHGRPPCRDRNCMVQSPILYPRRPTSVYPKFQKQLMDFRVPFVPDTFLAPVGVGRLVRITPAISFGHALLSGTNRGTGNVGLRFPEARISRALNSARLRNPGCLVFLDRSSCPIWCVVCSSVSSSLACSPSFPGSDTVGCWRC